MNFFLDFFNKLLKINEFNIDIIFDINGEIWFALKQIFISLGYTNIKKIVHEFNLSNEYKKKYKYIKLYSLYEQKKKVS
jgi:prophage antirepressor-like protein